MANDEHDQIRWSYRVAHEVIEKQLVDPRGLLVGCVMADTRQGYKAVIRLDEFGRTFGGYAAHRVVGLSPNNSLNKSPEP